MRLTQNKKKINKLNIVVRSCCSKRLLCDIHCFTISIHDSVSEGYVPHTYKELIGVIMTFEHENRLQLKSPLNNVASGVVITEKKQSNSDKSYMPGTL